MKAEWGNAINECDDLITRLATVDPLVIDYFPGQNPHLGDIGKFFIAWVLLEYEAVFIEYGINNNRRELPSADIRQNGSRESLIHPAPTTAPSTCGTGLRRHTRMGSRVG